VQLVDANGRIAALSVDSLGTPANGPPTIQMNPQIIPEPVN
jgi:hypothetical protein